MSTETTPPTTSKFTNYILIALVVLVIILAIIVTLLYKANRDKANDYQAMQIALSNKLDTFTKKNGEQIAKVQAAVFATNGGMKDAVKQLNQQGANIQSKVDNATQGLILLDKKIGGTLKGNTTISKEDTVTETTKTKTGKDSSITTILPEYKIDTTTKWYSLTGTVGPKRYAITPVYYDSTELLQHNINGGFLKPSVFGIESLNKNPYAKTTGLKYLQVKKTPAPIWKLIGGILIFTGGVYLGHHL